MHSITPLTDTLCEYMQSYLTKKSIRNYMVEIAYFQALNQLTSTDWCPRQDSNLKLALRRGW